MGFLLVTCNRDNANLKGMVISNSKIISKSIVPRGLNFRIIANYYRYGYGNLISSRQTNLIKQIQR